MWVIFLLAALTVAITTLIVIYIGHRVIMQIEKERNQKKQKKKR
jgi:uncharacterized membrane protein